MRDMVVSRRRGPGHGGRDIGPHWRGQGSIDFGKALDTLERSSRFTQDQQAEAVAN